ncbi:MAG TPA: TRAP transporter substrate-binding protein DctP [Kofleriaceae bacterium]|nr:TRAP transporter substrate-binding protein DctP [Kofleriaceae bacterium]
MKTIIVASILAALAAPALADGTELRIATLAPSGSTWSKKLAKASADINEKTEKRVSLKWYEGGSQGDEKDFVRKIGLGQLDGAAITSVGLSMIDESIRVLELPGMFDSIEEMDYVAGKMWPKFKAAFEKKGYVLADRGDVGWFYILSKDKIESLKDLQGAKPWLWGDDKIVKALYGKLGVSGVPLGVPEVDAALTSGRINACYGSPLAAVALQWATKVKYRTDVALFYGVGATVISKKAFDALDPKDQKTILDRLAKSGNEIRKAVRQDNVDADKGMQRSGVKVTTISFKADFQKAAEATWNDLAGSVYTKDQLADVLKYRQEYRDKHKK